MTTKAEADAALVDAVFDCNMVSGSVVTLMIPHEKWTALWKACRAARAAEGGDAHWGQPSRPMSSESRSDERATVSAADDLAQDDGLAGAPPEKLAASGGAPTRRVGTSPSPPEAQACADPAHAAAVRLAELDFLFSSRKGRSEADFEAWRPVRAAYAATRRPSEAVESECERLYSLALGAWPEIDEGDHARMRAAFKAALARQIAAAEQRGYDKGYAAGDPDGESQRTDLP